MIGRDPREQHRGATPLELLFDLTCVIAFGVAAAQLAHALGDAAYLRAAVGFGFACFSICWAWINFSWFASAYDNDDWIFRTATMVQMTGVIILAIGLPRMNASIGEGGRFDIGVMVLGYVVMRAALLFQWLRAMVQDPSRRRTCSVYVATIACAQVGWIALIFADFSLPATLVSSLMLIVFEMTGPYLAERRYGGTTWHARHISERYSLLAIIALGEGVVGTVAGISAVVDGHGWTLDAALICVSGTGLTFAVWWIYHILPSARVLEVDRGSFFVWGYCNMLIVAAIVATGAGLHVAALFIENHVRIGPVATLLTVAGPLSAYLAVVYALHTYLVREADLFHVWLLSLTALVIGASLAAAASGLGVAPSLVILMFAPAVTVVGYELAGHRHQAASLERNYPDN